MQPIELTGLDGGNLLGYLAALGTLRVLTMADRTAHVRMSWADKEHWTPLVHHPHMDICEELITVLEPQLSGPIEPAWQVGDDLTLNRGQFREHLAAQLAAVEPSKRETVDWLAAFGSEVYGVGPKKERMSDTEIRAIGGGQQCFLGTMRELAAGTDAGHLRRTLFAPWDYSDDRPSMRWDPADYRPHALRADNPSKAPIKTMRGANLLAVQALPLFPVVPSGGRAHTTGFQVRDGRTEITWPIWIDPLDVNTISSLLASPEVQEADRHTMIRRGIVQIFRARRYTEGQYRNFSPAKTLL